VLELDVEADPIAGRLRDHDGEAFDFTGWLGLASALERLLDAPGQPDGLEVSGPDLSGEA
jgi:hypothetical protein